MEVIYLIFYCNAITILSISFGLFGLREIFVGNLVMGRNLMLVFLNLVH
jgi:hypothetical protein